MKNKIYETYDSAVKDIPDGVTIIALCFIGAGGIPQNLLFLEKEMRGYCRKVLE